MSEELTLDPQDWDAFETLAHRMLSETLTHLRTLRDRPAWQRMPDPKRSLVLDEPLPFEAQGEEAVYEEFVRDILPYPNGNYDPRFWGWVQGNGFPLGNMADLLASSLNPHLAGFDQAPVLVEKKVIEWLRELMGFPEGSSGILLSGGSMASITGLAVARQGMAGFDVRKEGLQGDNPKLLVYGSTETHSWAKKAMEFLGFGHDAYRTVRVNPDFTLDLGALRDQIRKDRANGFRPIAILGTAGTVNTGASDDLDSLADLCAEEKLWLHVDGAFGALAAISPKLKHLVKGIERADSVSFDLHKWMYMPFEIACLLVRDGKVHEATFSQSASYIAGMTRGVNAGGLVFGDLGVELTRSFKALKAWMSLKAYGVKRFSDLIEQNVEQAQYLAGLVRATPDLELLADVPLNIVCFRYVVEDEGRANVVNEEILLQIQEQGIAVPSSTVLNGQFCLRVCIVNHRTRREDLAAFVTAVKRIGREIVDAK